MNWVKISLVVKEEDFLLLLLLLVDPSLFISMNPLLVWIPLQEDTFGICWRSTKMIRLSFLLLTLWMKLIILVTESVLWVKEDWYAVVLQSSWKTDLVLVTIWQLLNKALMSNLLPLSTLSWISFPKLTRFLMFLRKLLSNYLWALLPTLNNCSQSLMAKRVLWKFPPMVSLSPPLKKFSSE